MERSEIIAFARGLGDLAQDYEALLEEVRRIVALEGYPDDQTRFAKRALRIFADEAS